MKKEIDALNKAKCLIRSEGQITGFQVNLDVVNAIVTSECFCLNTLYYSYSCSIPFQHTCNEHTHHMSCSGFN